MLHNVKVFRLNVVDWWAGYDIASVNSAYLAETGKKGDFDQEELPREAMNTVRLYRSPYAKQSSTFQEELTRMIDEGQEFPCSFAGRYTNETRSSIRMNRRRIENEDI